MHLIVDKTMEQSLAFIGVKTGNGESLVVDKVAGQVKGFPECGFRFVFARTCAIAFRH